MRRSKPSQGRCPTSGNSLHPSRAPTSAQFCVNSTCRVHSHAYPDVTFCLPCHNDVAVTCLTWRDSLLLSCQPWQKASLFSGSHFRGDFFPLIETTLNYTDVFLACHRPSVWDRQESVNFNMRSKDYQKMCPSFPGWGRFLLVMLLMATLPLTSAMSPPPNYSQSNMPTTNFTCADKSTGGYYADLEAHCQMFHVCVQISPEEIKDFRFLCPNDTVFDQQNFICTNWWEISCETSKEFYDKNKDLFGGNQTPEYEYENIENPVLYEYIYEYADPEETSKTQTEGQQNLQQPLTPVQEHREHHRLGLEKVQRENHKGRAIELSAPNEQESRSSSRHSGSGSISSTTVSTTATTKPSTTTISSTVTLPDPRISSTTQRPHRLIFQSVSPESRTLPPTPIAAVSNSKTTRNRGDVKMQHPTVQEEAPNVLQERTQALNLDAQDPFADYDWKRDSSGVTASARTRYETLFGRQQSRERTPVPPVEIKQTPRPLRSRILVQSITTTTTPSPLSKERGSSRRRQTQRQRLVQETNQNQQNPLDQRVDEPVPEAKHKEFSNFRFYKTAFGRSYSSDDYLGDSGTQAPQIRVSDPIRVERIASRNTRYSIYA